MKKCEHGVYDPHGDAKYCTVCNPIPLSADTKIEVSKNIKLASVERMTPKENKAQEKYERRLEKNGLGIYQPMTDNSEGELAEVGSGSASPSNIDALVKLRKTVDGNDIFMDGHQITKYRRMWDREIPEWAMSNAEVQRIVLSAFPKLKDNPRQAKKAGRWVRIIYLYYRMKQPHQIVAKEMKMKESTLTSTIRNISRVARGLTVMGKERRHPSSAPVRDPERKDENI